MQFPYCLRWGGIRQTFGCRAAGSTADLSLSLEVVFHLVEDSVFDTCMRRLVGSAPRFVIVYASNMDQDWPDKHVRHRQFTRWVERNEPEWRL
jgi:hypothetical protein